MSLNTNQLQYTPVNGQLDLNVIQSGVLACRVSPNQATDLTTGDRVKLDPAITSGFMPAIVKAGVSDVAIGVIAFGSKQNTFGAGDICNVGCLIAPVIWMTANEEISPADVLQDNANGNMEVFVAAKKRGIAIDYASGSGSLFRMFFTSALQLQ